MIDKITRKQPRLFVFWFRLRADVSLRALYLANLSLTALDFACIIIFQMPAEIEIESELESTVAENVTGKAFVATESAAYSDKQPKRPPGRKRKDGAPPGSVPSVLAKDVPSPKYTSFYSDHDNPAQKTRAAWTWWKGLKPAQQDLLDAHVYRTWPVLLDPIDESEHKYIDKIIGAEPIQNDQDFIDRWGAGDYTLYLNVNPANGQRRTLFIAHVKCTHDFRKFTPTDRRIDNIENLSVTDPANAAYVAWLRANGKLKDEVKDAKEKEEMATATQGMTELLGKSIERGDRLMEKVVELHTADNSETPDVPSPKEVLTDQLAMLKSLKELTPTSDPIAMVNAVIGMAQVLTQKGDTNAELRPLMDEISKLREESRATEREFFRTQLTEIKDQLRAAKETPQSNITLPDGTSVESIINKVVDRLSDKPEISPWLDVVKSAIPFVGPALNAFAARLMQPAPQPPQFPMPPVTYQAGAQPPQPAQLPAPAQPQQAAPQTGGSYTTGNPQLDTLLMAVVIPLADCLRDGETGAVFAEEFVETQGIEVHAMLSQVGVEPIANIIAAYPPLAGVMKKITREKLLRFVQEFCEYKPAEVPSGGAA